MGPLRLLPQDLDGYDGSGILIVFWEREMNQALRGIHHLLASIAACSRALGCLRNISP